MRLVLAALLAVLFAAPVANAAPRAPAQSGHQLVVAQIDAVAATENKSTTKKTKKKKTAKKKTKKTSQEAAARRHHRAA